ncbi:sensor histidine kinase [Paraglaciecola sp. 20A4]|uniref:sensor histidine kinase n=1 Tax=Paraglaciecola sp. 20A4 TaxID=2687288 RepID=UPI001F0D6ECF|nr:sensor histidine kinase [Paraglaciecola sp. 20A4]|tara:strand:- start:12302 stop:13483 length:1182 start_codon:yes stop_codon:yes gene_type:complete
MSEHTYKEIARVNKVLRKLDNWLLPRNLSEPMTPYLLLIYLPFFFVPVAVTYQQPIELLWSALATLAFLLVYFRCYWAPNHQLIHHIIAILVIGSLAALLSPTANTFFIYAGAMCSRLKSVKFAVTTIFSILLWMVAISFVLKLSVYFYIPGLTFTAIIGLMNTYQYALQQNKQALILSRKETQRLAKVAERERIARDLHDLIGHTFSVITIKADLAGRLLDKDVAKARVEIKQLEDIARDALSQVREVVSGYRTSDLLSELANAKNVFAGVDIDFTYHFDNLDEQHIDLVSSANKELAIVLRELVTNILRHAKASNVSVTVKKLNEQIVLTVHDDGQGFEQISRSGFGIQGIEERMRQLGGSVQIKSGGGFKGTLTEIVLPINDKGPLYATN